MRFGKHDIEIYIKRKGEDEQYRKVDFERICKEEDIPKFNHELKWRKKNDTADRRRADLSPARGAASIHG